MTIEVRRLEAGDDRSRFRTGDPDLDRFFHEYAGQNPSRHHSDPGADVTVPPTEPHGIFPS